MPVYYTAKGFCAVAMLHIIDLPQPNSLGEGLRMRLTYKWFSETSTLQDGTAFHTYGVRCMNANATHAEQICSFHDVALDLDFTKRLCRLCTEEQIEPCHFLDVLYDMTP